MNLRCPHCDSEELFKKMDTRDFYELCQQYRHTPLDAAPEFEAIKEYLLTGKLPWPSYDDTEEPC